jgi:hypothetical protein
MLQDKVATAKKIDAFLKNMIASGAFKLKYRESSGAYGP